MTAKKRDMTGAKEAIKVSRWIEPWGDSRFPIDVDGMAKNCHSTYDRDDPITEIHGAPWKDVDGFLRRKSLSEILCVRHNMLQRSMYAKQDEQEESGGRIVVDTERSA